MRCAYFDAGICRSCSQLEVPYPEQLARKQRTTETLLVEHPGIEWLPPVASAERGFRNKAKMVVGGTLVEPTLGILDRGNAGVDLRECPITSPGIRAIFPELSAFITSAKLEPYSVTTRRGDLKHVLVTEAPDGQLMLRFVVRSEHLVGQIRKRLPQLLAALPALRVISVNLLPEHRAALEGEQEWVLTEADSLTMRMNDVPLHLRTRSFFQTNTPVAEALYRQGRDWVTASDPHTVWDLYCGVGGFALHSSAPGREVTGIEFSAEAILSAERTASELAQQFPGQGYGSVRFSSGDATAHVLAATELPDLVIVNPPRRGIGAELSGWLQRSGVQRVVYSSCNPVSLAEDLRAMPGFRVVRGRLFDMFPHTDHAEVIVFLERG